MGNVNRITPIVYIYDPGVFGVLLEEHDLYSVIKWYLDGIPFTGALEHDEYEIYNGGDSGAN
jgi:hypothetical protein